MSMKRNRQRLVTGLWLGLILLMGLGCAQEEEPTAVPTAEPTAVLEVVATIPPTPTTAATPTPRPTATPTATPLPPSLRVAPQPLGPDGRLVMTEVTLPDEGWLAVFPAFADPFTAENLLGAILLQPGVQPDVALTLDTTLATSTLQIALYSADGEAELDPTTAELLFLTELEVTLELVQPAINAADQEVLEDGLVRVEGVTSNGAGWLAIHNPDGTMLGYMPVPDGESTDIPVFIRWREALPELTLLLYSDEGEVGSFETADPPMLYDGQPVSHTIRITLPPEIVVFDQPIVGGNLTVERVISDGPAWLAVYQQTEEGQPGLILGSAALQDGLNSHVTITLTTASLTEVLLLTLHDDTTPGADFDFPANDPPRRYQGRAFFTPVNTAVGSYLIMRDQPLAADNSVVVPWLVVEADSWVVVTAVGEDGQPSGELLGRAWLPAGVSRQISIILEEPPTTPANLAVQLVQDGGTIQMFEPTVDTPLLRRGRTLVVPFTLE